MLLFLKHLLSIPFLREGQKNFHVSAPKKLFFSVQKESANF
jgi:hypothetical protein